MGEFYSHVRARELSGLKVHHHIPIFPPQIVIGSRATFGRSLMYEDDLRRKFSEALSHRGRSHDSITSATWQAELTGLSQVR
jgi:hypothetical protein